MVSRAAALVGICGYASLFGYLWVRPTALVGYMGSMGYMG